MGPAKTALVIDDDPEFRNLLAEILRQNQWRVLLAEDGEQGIQSAKEHLPDVVLCDLLMAHGNGFQVCRALRALEPIHRPKIIVASGSDFPADRQAAFEAGADDYLIKPIRSADLLSVLSRVTPQSNRLEPPPVSHAPNAAPRAASWTEGLRLKFWGVRGSIPTPGPATVEYGGNTSCVEVRAAAQIIILDAGTGLRPLGGQLLAEFGDQPLELTLLLTHTHWDHIQGLPFFPLVYRPQNQLRILGYEGARPGLDAVLTSQMESPFFPIGLSEVPANIKIEELKNLEFHLGQVRVQAFFAYHPGICVGYRLSYGGRSLAFFPDNELRYSENRPAGHATPQAGAAEFARNEHRKLIEFLRGTDVLIMDTQYDREEYQAHIGWGHGCLDEVIELALDSQIKHLFLFHHDPDHDDAKISQMVSHARQLVGQRHGPLQVEAAREGLVLELPVLQVQGA